MERFIKEHYFKLLFITCPIIGFAMVLIFAYTPDSDLKDPACWPLFYYLRLAWVLGEYASCNLYTGLIAFIAYRFCCCSPRVLSNRRFMRYTKALMIFRIITKGALLVLGGAAFTASIVQATQSCSLEEDTYASVLIWFVDCLLLNWHIMHRYEGPILFPEPVSDGVLLRDIAIHGGPEMREDVVGCPVTECAICIEDFVPTSVVRRLPCGHLFHSACINLWVGGYNRSCPLCRAPAIRPASHPVVPPTLPGELPAALA